MPEGVIVENKSGLLSTREDGLVRGDAAIIHGEAGSFVLAFIGTHTAVEESEQVIRDITTIVYEHLQGRSSRRRRTRACSAPCRRRQD